MSLDYRDRDGINMRKTKNDEYFKWIQYKDHEYNNANDDVSYYDYLCRLVSELKSLKIAHIVYAGTDDMISYSIGKAIEYCERELSDIKSRMSGQL